MNENEAFKMSQKETSLIGQKEKKRKKEENKAFITYSSQNPKEGKKAISHYKVLKKNKNIKMIYIYVE